MTQVSYEEFYKAAEEIGAFEGLDKDSDVEKVARRAYAMLFLKEPRGELTLPAKVVEPNADTSTLPESDWIPRYQSIKLVQAFKIKSIVLVEGGYRLEAEGSPHGVVVDKAYFDKHQPKTGGYYVHYEDGYQSWSPAPTFESGYILIEEDYCPPKSMSLEDHVDEAIEAQHPNPNPSDDLEDPVVNLDKDA